MAKKYEPPAADGMDTAHSITKDVIGAIPVVGAPAQRLFEIVVTPSLERRRIEWMNDVAEGLRKLEEAERFNIEDLAKDEAFMDAMLQASTIAQRNSNETKLNALRNAVLNSALPSAPDESRRQMFLAWVDDLSVWHLRIFTLLADPLKWFKSSGKTPPQYHLSSSISGLICDAYPEMKDERSLYDQIGKDLFNRGLIGSQQFHTMMSADGAFQHRATELGKKFLAFITEPTE